MEPRVRQVLRRHLLGFTWPPVAQADEEELRKRADAAKQNGDASYVSLLLDVAEVLSLRSPRGVM